MSKLTDEQRAQALAVAEAILSLEGSEAWGHFTKAAEALIESNMPRYASYSAGQEAYIASKMVYIQGIRDCLAIVQNSKKRRSDLQPKQD